MLCSGASTPSAGCGPSSATASRRWPLTSRRSTSRGTPPSSRCSSASTGWSPVRRVAWRRPAGILATFPEAPECAFRAAALTNMLGVIALGDAEDYRLTAALARRFGHQQVVQVQNECDDLLRIGPGLPMITAFCRQLARRGHIERVLERAGVAEDEAIAIASKCHNQAFWLLLADVDASVLRPAPTDPDEMIRLMEKADIGEWRKVAAVVAANPWVPRSPPSSP